MIDQAPPRTLLAFIDVKQVPGGVREQRVLHEVQAYFTGACSTWGHPGKSLWILIGATKSVEQIVDDLRKNALDARDTFMVFDVAINEVQGWAYPELWTWMRKNGCGFPVPVPEPPPPPPPIIEPIDFRALGTRLGTSWLRFLKGKQNEPT